VRGLETYSKPCLSNRTSGPSSKWARWEERWSAACRAHVTHRRVAHAGGSLSRYIGGYRKRDVKVIALCYGRSPTYGLYATTTVLWCERFFLVWSFPIILAGTCTQHLNKVSNSFLIWILRTGPYPILEHSAELYPARISFFDLKGVAPMSPPAANSLSSELYWTGRSSPPVCFSNLSVGLLAKSSPVTTEEPTRAGRLFCFTIRPGRLSLPSVAYEFTSIPGWVLFPFDFFLVAVTWIRASVSTPSKLTWRGIHSREQTQLLHTPRSTPSCIFIQDPSRRVEVLQGTHYSEYPPQKRCVCQVRFFAIKLGGFDQKCYAYAQDYPSSRKLRGDYFTTTDDRP